MSTRTYSLAHALQLASGDDSGGPERELSDELRRGLSLPAMRNGIFLPTTFAALGTGEEGGGAELVIERAGPFSYALRPRPLLQRLGATVISGVREGLRVPRVSGPPEIVWASESAEEPVEDAGMLFGEAVPPIKTATATIGVSRQLLRQARGDAGAEQIIRRELERAVAAAVDYGALAGAGGDEPTGVAFDEGVPEFEMGGALTAARLLEIERLVADANADDGASFVTSPAVRESAKQVARGSGFLWQDDKLVDRRAFASPLLPTLGDSADPLHVLLYGSWQHLVVALHATEVLVDMVSFAKQGIAELTVFAYLSVAVGQPLAFRRILDVTV